MPDSMYRNGYCSRCFRNLHARIEGVCLKVFCPRCGQVSESYSPHQALGMPLTRRLELIRLLERTPGGAEPSQYQWLDIAGDTGRREG